MDVMLVARPRVCDCMRENCFVVYMREIEMVVYIANPILPHKLVGQTLRMLFF